LEGRGKGEKEGRGGRGREERLVTGEFRPVTHACREQSCPGAIAGTSRALPVGQGALCPFGNEYQIRQGDCRVYFVGDCVR